MINEYNLSGFDMLPPKTKIIIPTFSHWFHYEVVARTEDNLRIKFIKCVRREDNCQVKAVKPPLLRSDYQSKP